MKKHETEFTKAQFIGGIILAVIGSIVATTFSLIRIANTDHFTIVAIGDRVTAIEKNFVSRTEYESISGSVEQMRKDVREDIKDLNSKIDRLLERK